MGRVDKSRTSFSTNPSDYKLLEEVGYGGSATVHRAIYLPSNEVIAVKCLDLDRCNNNLDDIRKEAQTMSLIDHPNVIKAFCSFVVERSLWVVMPFMAGGSCLHLLKMAYPDGFEESVIATILKETLKALDYLHQHGDIHRDVKAGNILVDANGAVKLGDFGVSACMFEGDRQRTRNTFKGTPCWMAPEILQPGCGYDFKADIWSFGITALELAHGHAPFSKYPPMKVLLMTIQNAPPGLDYDRDKKFSKSFKEMVAMCLVKDQTKRPTTEKLLKHSFFKHAKPPEVSVKNLVTDLPPLWDCVKALQLKDAAQLALKKMPSAEQEAMSQSEYKRGVSAWNFDVEDLKAQASLVQDYEDVSEIKEVDENMRLLANEKNASTSTSMSGKFNINGVDRRGSISGANFSQPECSSTMQDISETHSLDCSNPKNFDGHEKYGPVNGSVLSGSDKDIVQGQPKNQLCKTRQSRSGPLMPNTVLSHSMSERGRISERFECESQSTTEKCKRDVRKAPSFSGPLMLPNKASSNSYSAPIRSSGGFCSLEDKSKANLVQVKGRFSVTSENMDHAKDISLSTIPRRSQGSPLRKSASVGDWLLDSKQVPVNQSPKEVSNSALSASFLMPYLQNLFQQTAVQQDLIMTMLSNLQQFEFLEGQTAKLPPLPRTSENCATVETASERELLLLQKISELQTKMININDELTAERLKHMRLQKQLNGASVQEEDNDSRRGERHT